MKKFLYCVAAMASMLFAASCQQEKLETFGEGHVTFTVTAPGELDTRAIADGKNVNEVHYAVYKTDSGVPHSLYTPDEKPLAQGFVTMLDKKATLELDLLQDQNYTILFWAQVKPESGKEHYILGDLREVKIKYTEVTDPETGKTYCTVKANDESRAAFFRRYDFNTTKQSYEVMLYRPFAQINLGTTPASLTPKQEGEQTGYEIDVLESEMEVEGIASSFDLIKGEGKNEAVNYRFTSATTPAKASEKLSVNDIDYHYVGMNYLLVPILDKNVTVSYKITTDKGVVDNSIKNVPVKENYRTNIIGNLLTSKTDFEIIVDERFDGEYYGPDFMKKPAYDEATKTYTVAEYYELVWFADQVNNQNNSFDGQTVKLATDIDLAGKTWTPIGASGAVFKGTFEGAVPVTKSEGETRNAVISNLKVAAEAKESAGLFANSRGLIKNLNVVDAEITGHYKTGVIVGDGLCSRVENCHVDNATILVTPYKENEANNVGGIVGYLSGEPTAYVKGCSVKNSNITAYRKVGGIVGAANRAAEVSGNFIESSVITADQTSAYNEDKPADAGAVVGWAASTAVVKDNEVAGGINTANANAVKVVIKAKDSAVDFSESEVTVLPSGEYNLEEDVKSAGLQVNNGNDVTINANGSALELGSPNVYGFVAEGEGTTLVINDADVNSLGGGIGAASGANVTVNNSTIAVNSPSTSGRYNIYAVGEGTVVTINSGTFSFSKTLNQKRAYIYCGAGATVYVKGGTFGKASARSGYTAGILSDGDVIITGGTFGFDPTAWVAEGYAATKVGTEWHVAPATL